jgi:hypothetical protein
MTTRIRLHVVHGAAGLLALLTILVFWGATVAVEVSGGPAAVAAVKSRIAWALLLLIPLLAVAGATGMTISGARPRPAAARKLRRMRFVAANGLLVLVPSALFLAWKAGAGQLDAAFVAVQAAELAAGAANIVLLTLNLRDGLRMHRRSRSAVPAGLRTNTIAARVTR